MEKYSISTGKSRFEKHWKNTNVTWVTLVNKLGTTIRTHETQGEFLLMTKSEQDKVKDVGGFVGGKLKNGIRRRDSIEYRSIISLDLDYADEDFAGNFGALYDYNYVIYSTHKHSKEKQRLRLVLPLSRNCTSEEYEAISRKIAYEIGIDMFDDSTYQSHRLMYYPSTSSDAEYLFLSRIDGIEVNVDDILSRYKDWTDISEWHVSSRTEKLKARHLNKQVDPTEKEGLIGAFCRTYDIHNVIEKYLYNVYEVANNERYTYLAGSTSAGAVIYEDGKFIFSNHATDPAGQILCNSFDLIRLHLFADEDEDVKPDTPVNKLPSFIATCEFINKDENVKTLIYNEKKAEVLSEFSDYIEDDIEDEDGEKVEIENTKDDDKWFLELKVDKNGNVINLIENAFTILKNDRRVANKVKYNDFTKRVDVVKNLPWNKDKSVRGWSDNDDAGLRYYLEKMYGLKNRSIIDDAFTLMTYKNRYHPVQEYLNSLIWDGVHRLENVLIEYLGVENNEYTKAITKMHFVASAKRIFENGCKYDEVLVLVGKQGAGKSEFIKRIGVNWYSDTLDSVQGKDAYEQLQGVWVMELGELAALSKRESETIKLFLAKREDNFRSAYAKRTETHKRQCVFWGTTNTYEFLKDMTGNRRFLPIDIDTDKATKSIFDELDGEINQIWAEVMHEYKKGAKTYIASEELKYLAKKEQDKHLAESNLTGEILMHLEKDLPKDWNEYDLSRRVMFYRDDEFGIFDSAEDNTVKREKVCVMEIWCEMLGEQRNTLTQMKSKEIKDILIKSGEWENSNSSVKFGSLYGRQRAFRRLNIN